MEPLGEDDPRRIGPHVLVGRLEGSRSVPPGRSRFVARTQDAVRTVLVDVVLNSADQDVGHRFRAEAEQARRLGGDAPWLASVEEFSAVDELRPWLSSGFVPAISLPRAIAVQRGGLPVGTVMTLAMALAECLQALHGAGYVHAGLLPENVLLAATGPRLCGFGAVRVAAADGEDRSRVPGLEAGCVAPEQLAGGRPRPPGDVYGLGVVLAYAATGRLVVEEEELPARLRPIVGSCLYGEPAERPTASALLEELAPRGSPSGETSGTGVHAPAGELATEMGSHHPTAVDPESGAGLAAEAVRVGWLPPSLIAQIADGTAAVLAAEPEDEPAEPSYGVGRVRSTVLDGDGASAAETAGRKRDGGSTSGHGLGEGATAASGRGRSLVPSRRTLLSGVGIGTAGAVLGAGGVHAVMRFTDGSDHGPSVSRGVSPQPLWTRELSGEVPQHKPTVWRNRTLLISRGRSVIALNMSTGDEEWVADRLVSFDRLIDVGGGLIAVPENGPTFLEAETGKKRWGESNWEGNAGISVRTALGYREGVLLLAAKKDGEAPVVMAYEVANRKLLWTTSIPKDLGREEFTDFYSGTVGPVLWEKDNTLVIQEMLSLYDQEKIEKRFVAIRGSDGRKLWTHTYEGVTGDVEAVGLRKGSGCVLTDGELWSFRLRDGKREWSTEIPTGDTEFPGALTVHGGRVYAVHGEGVVTALNGKTGRIEWRTDSRTPFFSENRKMQVRVSPSGKTVIVVLGDEVLALEARDGSMLWRFVEPKREERFNEDHELLLEFSEGAMVMIIDRSVYTLPVP